MNRRRVAGRRVSGGVLALSAAVTLTGACASGGGQAAAPSLFDVHYDVGAWAEAAAVFESSESDADARADDWTLYRAGLIYAHPDADVFDPERAQQVLGSLVEWYPESRYAPSASAVRGLVAALGRSSRAVEALREQLDQMKKVDLKIVPPPPPPPSRR